MSKIEQRIKPYRDWLDHLLLGICLGAVTGIALRLVTTPASSWLYTIIAGYLLGLLTAMLIMWLFISIGSLLSRRTRNFFDPSPARIIFKMIGLALVALLIVAAYLALIYTLNAGFYWAATGAALILFVPLLSLFVVSLGVRTTDRVSPFVALLYLIPVLFMCAGSGFVITLVGSLGLLTAILLLLLDTLLPVLSQYWLLSGLLCGSIAGATVLAIGSYRPPKKKEVLRPGQSRTNARNQRRVEK